MARISIDGLAVKTLEASSIPSKTAFYGAGRLVADAIVIPFRPKRPYLNITELEPAGGRFVGKTVARDGTIKQYSSGAWFNQSVATVPATIPSLFRYLRDGARQRNIFLIRGAPANLERKRTRRQIAHIVHDGINRGDHGFVDKPSELFFLDFDGVARQWQADPEGAVKNIVSCLGAPYSDTDFVWFFSSKHGLKLDQHKAWRGKLSDTDVRVRVAFIAARALNQAEAVALTKALKAGLPELKIDPAVSRLVQPNYIHRPRWQGHLDCDVLGDLPTIGWVQGSAKFLAVPADIKQPTTSWSQGDGNIASHPDAEAAADAVGGDGSIRSHLMCAIGHMLQANPTANEASVVTELRDMVEQRRGKIEPNLKQHGRKWVEVQNYFPDDMARFATWWIERNRPQLQGVVVTYPLENYPIAKPARGGTKDMFAGFLTNDES
jgi:hypothetical protein